MRLEIINQQGRIGDIEMDLILGASQNEVILRVVDGKTDYIFIESLLHRRKCKSSPLVRVVNRGLAFFRRG